MLLELAHYLIYDNIQASPPHLPSSFSRDIYVMGMHLNIKTVESRLFDKEIFLQQLPKKSKLYRPHM